MIDLVLASRVISNKSKMIILIRSKNSLRKVNKRFKSELENPSKMKTTMERMLSLNRRIELTKRKFLMDKNNRKRL
jgi:hypothetical protein